MNLAAFDGLTPLEIFRRIAFELKAYPDEIVQAHIDMVDVLFCVDGYGDAADVFRALMAAHLMALPGGVANANKPAGVQSIKEKDLSISYATSNASNFKVWLAGSRFGELILMLRRKLGMGLAFHVVSTPIGCDADYASRRIVW